MNTTPVDSYHYDFGRVKRGVIREKIEREFALPLEEPAEFAGTP